MLLQELNIFQSAFSTLSQKALTCDGGFLSRSLSFTHKITQRDTKTLTDSRKQPEKRWATSLKESGWAFSPRAATNINSLKRIFVFSRGTQKQGGTNGSDTRVKANHSFKKNSYVEKIMKLQQKRVESLASEKIRNAQKAHQYYFLMSD